MTSAVNGNQKPYQFTSEIPFQSENAAEVVCDSLSVDPELRPQFVDKQLSRDGKILKVYFAATEIKMLRAAVGTFLDLLKLAIQTVEQFSLEQETG
eukprot:TRINITY_DN1165_c0_g1_i1.p7 TRINITY_DN1165_c0_g1~~TRINITY_DN1165_c0_g1_i1.p7  ORF type:complete len:105 (-),score=4.89 TRINITY_DN1165_c0_g1_i1:1164-1451(-)